MKREKLYAKLSKCKFRLASISFLGHTVSKEGVMVDSQNIKKVKSWARPTSVIEVHRFVVLSSYYLRFVKVFASIATHMTRLT